MEKLSIKAKTENLDSVTEFIESQLAPLDLPMRTQMQINLAVEELFVNISYYAYAPGEGMAVIAVSLTDDRRIIITFMDSGKPFNPLEKDDPDISTPLEDRRIGGLGILMVKKSMDNVSYAYRDGQNILTLKKNL